MSSARQRRRRRLYPALAALTSILLLAAVAVGAVRVADAGSDERPRGAGEREAAATAALTRAERPGGREATEGRGRARPAAGRDPKPIRWRNSTAVGSHAAGKLEGGVLLPAWGRDWVSWDPVKERKPNRQWRRWGTDVLIRSTLRVLRDFRADHPRAPRLAVGDLSRPEGGDFGPRFGSIGHASHQSGLDIDIYYPRKDRRVRPPDHPGEVDLRLSQDLVDRFVAAGAEKVFTGPSLPLTGPGNVVVPLVHHDNHIHVRLPTSAAG